MSEAWQSPTVNESMKRFLRQLALFGGLQLLIGLTLWSQIRQEASHYLAGTIQKHRALADRSEPRLILVGGSSLAYGIDSQTLAERSGYRPVNMGLHAGLGIEFMCREVLDDLAEGDIVVLSPEYPCYGQTPDALTQFHLIEQRPESAKHLQDWSWRSTRDALDRWALPYVGAIARRGVRGMNLRLREWRGRNVSTTPAFNEYGDYVGHHGAGFQPSAAQPLFTSDFTTARLPQMIAFLRDFHRQCRQRGATVYYSFCPVPDRLLAEQRQVVSEIEAALRRSLDIPILDSPEEASFALEAFYDTPYHLNWEGRTLRSERLAENLSRQGAILAAERRMQR